MRSEQDDTITIMEQEMEQKRARALIGRENSPIIAVYRPENTQTKITIAVQKHKESS